MNSVKINIIIIISLCSFCCTYDFTIGSWEDGVIPYYLSGEFSNEDLTDIEVAMASWESVCGAKFEKVTPRSGAYGIIRVSENKWYSTIGENNSSCYMHFSAEYSNIDVIIHELGHCLGLVHEHQRPDRDLYVTIVWDKIKEGKEFDFMIMDNPLYEEHLFKYDYNSIMHYPPVSFSIDGSETIISNTDEQINRKGEITEYDALKVQAIYGPPAEE